MRRFSYRDPAAEGGVAVGSLADDGTVELADGTRRAVAELTPAPAVPRPGKVVCVGLNYKQHCDEQGVPYPDRPMLFAKFANAVIASGEPIIRPPGTHGLDLEVELGVVIGALASSVTREQALAHVAGYVVANDVSARDWQGAKPALGEGEHG